MSTNEVALNTVQAFLGAMGTRNLDAIAELFSERWTDLFRVMKRLRHGLVSVRTKKGLGISFRCFDQNRKGGSK